jgi:dolichol-phosphate mannosyltransferase
LNVWVVIPTYNEAANLELMLSTLLERLDWSAAGVTAPPSSPSPHGRPVPSGEPVLATSGGGTSEPSAPASAVAYRHAPNALARDDLRIHVLVVDDSSPDGTGELAEQLAERWPGQVHVLHRGGKLGLGSAYLAGFRLALERGADAVIEMDADFSHSPEYLPQMLALLQEGRDVVVGSRWAPGGRLDEKWEAWRYLLSKYANIYARWVTGLDVYDTTAGFKTWRGDALRGLPLERVRSDGYAFQIEMAVASQKHGFRIAELPIYFTERVRGQSKMSLRIILEAAWRVWQIRSRW